MQKELLEMNWPEILLQWSDCQPHQDPNTGALMWRGLRVRMGISWGRPSYKKPLNTGVHTLSIPKPYINPLIRSPSMLLCLCHLVLKPIATLSPPAKGHVP